MGCARRKACVRASFFCSHCEIDLGLVGVVCAGPSPRLLVCARDCWCVRWWHARQAWGGVRGEMWTFYVLNKKLDFPVFVSFPLPPPHTLTKSSDSRQTPQTSSRGGPLTFPPICLCHHAFLERRHYHGHTQIAAAVHTTRSTQVRASARNSSYIVRSESPPNWWGHWRYGWGDWRGGCCHRLRSQAQSTSVACANRRAKESQRERLSRANKWCRRSGGGRTARYTH